MSLKFVVDHNCLKCGKPITLAVIDLHPTDRDVAAPPPELTA
jgi:hypothetical protein